MLNIYGILLKLLELVFFKAGFNFSSFIGFLKIMREGLKINQMKQRDQKLYSLVGMHEIYI